MLVRKVLLPPMLAGAVLVGVLATVALTVASGSRASQGKSLFAGDDGGKLVTALSIELEGTPGARDIRAARLPLHVRQRMLERHPFYDDYVAAQQRYDVSWVLVAAVHYQETGFGKQAKRKGARGDVLAIARQLRREKADEGLGGAAVRAVSKRYGSEPQGEVSTAMVIERARAWRVLGTIPLPGRGELQTPAAGVIGGCGYFGCPRPGHLHNGVDFLAPSGTPIHAVDDGEVVLIETPGESGGYGNFTCVQHRPHLASCYAHQSAFADGLRVGSRVKRGQVIGLMGSTGSSTAPHLHFEVRRGPAECQRCAVDPLPLLSGEVPQETVPKMLSLPSVARAARPARAPAVAPAPPPVRTPVPTPAPAATAPPASHDDDEGDGDAGAVGDPVTRRGTGGATGSPGKREAVPDYDPAPGLGASKQPVPGASAQPAPAPAPRPAAPTPGPSTSGGGASGPTSTPAQAAPAAAPPAPPSPAP